MNKNIEDFKTSETLYKHSISSLFDRASKLYGSDYFSYFAKQLVNSVNISSNYHILDVATGRGAILKEASKKITNDGEIIGIDISSKMIEETKKELEALQINANLLQMDGENLLFNDKMFDVVFSSFGVIFMPNIKKALSEFLRVLRNNGVLAISTWGKGDVFFQSFKDVAKDFNLDITASFHPFSDTNPIVNLLKEIGFRDIEVKKDTFVQIYPNLEVWFNSFWGHGTRIILEKLTDLELKKFKSILFDKVKPFIKSDGVSSTLTAFYTLAKK